jgi:CubicO group peptidase (beta-lactamase class C family)
VEAATVHGTTDPAFAAVADTFGEFLADGRETGAALAAYVDGRLVVDVWGGWADAARTRPWTPDTVVTVFSAGKPLAALTLLRHIATGEIDLDAPVTRYWTEFGAAGKSAATVRHVLAHQAGVPAIGEQLTAAEAFDWDRVAAAIAATPAEWEPGTAVGEHALTYGHLIGTILHRATGLTAGRVLRDEIGQDLYFGVPEADLPRVAELEYASPTWPTDAMNGHNDLWARALGNPSGLLTLDVLNGHAWRTSQFPAVNAHCTARALAAVYNSLLPPRAPLLDEALAAQAEGHDRLLDEAATWTLGWRREESWVGMGGIGGSSAALDESARYAMAYVTRHLGDHDRSNACYDALEACL